MNTITDALKNIQLPPIVVKVEDDTIRNLVVAILFCGSLLLVLNVVLKKVTA